MVRVVKDDKIQIEKLGLGPFGTNAYIIICQQTSASVLIDAPAEASKILKHLKATDPKYILMTHSHMDHTGALSELKSSLNVPVAAHSDDVGGLPLKPDILLKDGDVLSGLGGLQIIHTPGHTRGSICLLMERSRVLFTGDTIINNVDSRFHIPVKT